MAYSPAAIYPSQIDTTDPGFPYGKAKNVGSLGDGTGTPLEARWVSELFGFQQALLAEAGFVPDGTQEKVGASQYLSAVKAVSDARSGLALSKAQAVNWPERVSFHDSGDYASPNGPICMAWAPDLGGAIPGGRFVLIGPSSTSGCQVWTSEDGNQFVYEGLQNAAATSNPCVAYGKIDGAPGFLMTWAGSSGLYTSLNGTSWGPVSATVPAQGVACWAQSLGLWVIAGNGGLIYTSPTALTGTWTARTTPAGWIAGCGGVKRVVFGNGLFVVLPLGSYNKVLTSPDGINWTERTLPATGLWTGLAHGDGIWMATPSNLGSCAVSANGTAWSSTGVNYTIGNDLAVLGQLWIMPTFNGNYGGIAWSVDRGATWTRGPTVGNHRIATAGWNRILAADGRFLLAHSTGTVCEVALSLRAA